MPHLTKIPLTTEKLLQVWIDKNLVIEDKQVSLDIIKRLNYYRLSGYAKYFYDNERNFLHGTTFNDIYNLYLFDSELRKVIMTLTEEIELNFRSYLSSFLAIEYGACSYLDVSNFQNKKNKNTNKGYYDEFLEIIAKKKETHKNKPYIKHYNCIYNGEIPIWVLVEILSFTDISKFIKNLKNTDRRKLIKLNYKTRINPKYLPNAINIICDVRNMCAHYEKVFNLNLINAPKLNDNNTINNSTLFDFLLICKKLITDNNKWTNSISDIEELIIKYNFSKLYLLGFKNSNWKNDLIK